MARYRYIGDTPAMVPDLQRYEDNAVQPGEEFETDVVINNATFELIDAPATPAPARPAPAVTPIPEEPKP